MSNETKKQLEEFRRLIRDAHAETLKDLSAAIAAETEAREASVKQFREKAEVEAFGHRFHAKLLAAMKSGSTNVVDMLGAAMDAAGVGHVDRVTGVVSNAPRGLDVVAAEAELQSPGDFPIIIKARTIRAAERALDNLKRDIAAREAPEKIAEPAPPALSVEERKWRKGVELALSAALGTEPDDLEDLLREVNRRLWRQAVPLGDAQVLVESKARDAALEEADRAGMSLRQYGTVADRYDSEGLKAAARTGWNAGANEVLAAIRALKSKPAPPSSASYGDFGWALQQLLAGKRVKQGDSPRSWRMREDGALVDQNGIVMRELHMDMVLAMNWRLAE